MTLLVLLWGLALVAAQTQTTSFWTNAADTCRGSSSPDECSENVPGCANNGCKAQRSWDISDPFAGEDDPGPAALRTTETDRTVKDDGGNTDWIILR